MDYNEAAKSPTKVPRVGWSRCGKEVATGEQQNQERALSLSDDGYGRGKQHEEGERVAPRSLQTTSKLIK